MTRYEEYKAELHGLGIRRAISVFLPTGIVAILAITQVRPPALGFVAAFVALVVLPIIFRIIWRFAFPVYRSWDDRWDEIGEEVSKLQNAMALIHARHPERRKGEQFKAAYGLSGRSARDLEEALAVGMHRERREVFVTAFMRQDVAVRVTASIGSLYRCSAADDPKRWSDYVVKLSCDEIRQYHNHPHYHGSTSPSGTDIKTTRALKVLLGRHAPKFRSFIICWNGLKEWKVFEHDETGRHWLDHEFDVVG